MLLTINSAGRVLELFTEESPERGVTEVAQVLGISKSKSHALLASLTEVGLLRRAEGGRYRLGWKLLSLNRVLADTTEFRVQARPVMATLASQTNAVIHLGTLQGPDVVYVDRIAGPKAIGIPVSTIGATLPAHCTGVGKALLASLSAEEARELVVGTEARTAATITATDNMLAELAEVRERGVAVDRGEALDSVRCVAAPITAPGPHVVAAISIATSPERFDGRETTYAQAITRAAAFISRRLSEQEELCAAIS